VAKSVGKFHKDKFYNDDYDYDRPSSYTKKKSSRTEVKREKSKIVSKLRNPTYEEVLELYGDDEWA
jgi:hypothetical protein